MPFSNEDSIPLGYQTEINGEFYITIDHLDGIFTNQSVFIEDREKNILHDLKSEPYAFSTEKGTFNNRFVLKFTNKTLSDNEFLVNKKNALVYQKKGQLIIESEDSIIDEIKVYDISGKLILEQKTNQNSNIITNLKPLNQTLILKIMTENGSQTKKVIY